MLNMFKIYDILDSLISEKFSENSRSCKELRPNYNL